MLSQIIDWWDKETPVEQDLEIPGLAIFFALLLCCCGRYCSKRSPEQKQAGVLRASFLGGSDKLPVAKLTQLDVAARWAKAEAAYQTDFEDGSAGQPDGSSLQRSISVGESGVARRRRRGADNALPVMFRTITSVRFNHRSGRRPSSVKGRTVLCSRRPGEGARWL